MGPKSLQQEQSQQLFADASVDAQSQKAQAELEATVLRFWDTVRKSADVIVTLRQENAILQSQVQSLRKSETELQTRVDDFLGHIAELERKIQDQASQPEPLPPAPALAAQATEDLIIKAHEAEVRALRTNIDRLEDELNNMQNALNEAQMQLGDHQAIAQQLAHVRTELDARTSLLLELQANLEEQRAQRLLERGNLDQRQLDIFGSLPQPQQQHKGITPAEMLVLASRLDALSGRISSLFGIS